MGDVIFDKALPVQREKWYHSCIAELILRDKTEEKVLLRRYYKSLQAELKCPFLIFGERPWVDYLQLNHSVCRRRVFFEQRFYELVIILEVFNRRMFGDRI